MQAPHKYKNYYIRGGEMAEWSNAAVLKTVVLLPRDRGFESLFLRQTYLNINTLRVAGTKSGTNPSLVPLLFA